MRFILSFFKSFFAIFGVAFITRTELIQEKHRLLDKLEKSYEDANKHLLEVMTHNEKVKPSKDKRVFNKNITEKPMFVKGELSQIDDILSRHGI